MEEIHFLVALSLINEIGPISQKALVKKFGSAEKVFCVSKDELVSVNKIGNTKAEAILNFNKWDKVKKIVENCKKEGIKIVSINDKNYPEPLREIEDAPFLIFKKGELVKEDIFAIAVVGSRKPTKYGLRVTDMIVGELVEAGFTIISGMARGIDTEAHKAAVLRKGRTIAVLGSGIDVPYPAENYFLMKKIEKIGAIITEFPLGTKPEKGNFPRRNRIISGLSMGVLVVEASSDSGALITARHALQQNKEVFAVPGMITSNTTKGTHMLLKEGAVLVESAEDIIKELAPRLKGFINEKKKKDIILSKEEETVIKHLTKEPIHIDILTRESHLPLNKLLSILTGLELKGVVKQTEGKRFYLL